MKHNFKRKIIPSIRDIVTFDFLPPLWSFRDLLNYTVLYLQRLHYITTRSSERSTPLPLAPAEGWGALRAVLGAFGPQS